MRGGLTSQQWLLLAAMLLGLLFNLLLRWIRQRAHETTGSQEPPRRAKRAPAHSPAPTRVPDAPRAPALPALPPGPRLGPGSPGSGRRRRVRGLGPRTARQAIVLMAVLGPCRAAAPQGPDAIPDPPR